MFIKNVKYIAQKNILISFLYFVILSLIGAISISFISVSAFINNETDDFIFDGLNEIPVCLYDVDKEKIKYFDQFYYSITSEEFTNKVLVDNGYPSMIVEYVNDPSLSKNEYCMNEKIDFSSDLFITVNDNDYQFKYKTSFESADIDMRLEKSFLFEEYNDAVVDATIVVEKDKFNDFYKIITNNNIKIKDEYNMTDLYSFISTVKIMIIVLAIVFILLSILILSCLINFLLSKEYYFFNLLKTLGYKIKVIFIIYFAYIFIFLLVSYIGMVLSTRIINSQVEKVLSHYFDGCLINTNYYRSIFIFMILVVFTVSYLLMYLFKHKKIDIGDDE